MDRDRGGCQWMETEEEEEDSSAWQHSLNKCSWNCTVSVPQQVCLTAVWFRFAYKYEPEGEKLMDVRGKQVSYTHKQLKKANELERLSVNYLPGSKYRFCQVRTGTHSNNTKKTCPEIVHTDRTQPVSEYSKQRVLRIKELSCWEQMPGIPPALKLTVRGRTFSSLYPQILYSSPS